MCVVMRGRGVCGVCGVYVCLWDIVGCVSWGRERCISYVCVCVCVCAEQNRTEKNSYVLLLD